MTASIQDHNEDRPDNEETPLLGSSTTDAQTHVLPTRQLVIVFTALAFVQFTSFLDQTAISTALPSIAQDLHTGSSISWVGASFLISSTSVQLINGRLSDIFGRKTCLITTLTVMGLGNLLSGFARTPFELYVTRAVSGLGAGAINALVQVTISDITTLSQRGNYFGIIGIFVALGNGLGPVIGGVLTKQASWRWAVWFISPMAALAVGILYFVLPTSRMSGNMWTKLKMVDWLGVIVSVLAVVLVLVCLLGVVHVDQHADRIYLQVPVSQVRLFNNGYSANILLAQNLAIGWVYWSNLFYLPMYFQNVRGWSPTEAGSLILPMVIAHGIFSGLSGFLLSWTGRYWPIVVGGTSIWTVATSGKAFYGANTPVWVFIAVGMLEGLGVGFCFQPVLVALMTNSANEDRAVMTGLRNFIRAMGGAVGITVSGAILSNVLQLGLGDKFSPEVIARLTSSVQNLPDSEFSRDEMRLILSVYMEGLHAVFISFVPLIALCFSSSLLVKNYPIGGKDKMTERRTQTGRASHDLEEPAEVPTGRDGA
ncbi:putative efflux pump antibiotic resistance protein [Aspergillus novofumigatus IBT 16806]|uniref:Putative efflux pump antibiotic resistance protein n=1 Tax=Aspergillus novofumigatus (strain IBT 16806) TaxID=1392255 RepID=A0A2I1C0S2_ASPN1|nr:putative efflux pump antibiotic resistance protein [Aspergillus novofumigatus IBT 16806]PKX91219.1 putative efflux pump antibiotic resistance protein [Aspergillus novofumigatus IBT 16806]